MEMDARNKTLKMNKYNWQMSDYNLAEDGLETFDNISDIERINLGLLVDQVNGWSNQDIDTVVSVMAEDGVYHDITLEPAIGHKAIREFGSGWLDAVPDLSLYI